MRKNYVVAAVAAGLLLAPAGAFAKMGSGQLSAKSKDIDVEFFGSLKSYPHFMTDIDFNDQNTNRDFILDENGFMKDHSVRNELRIGWKGEGKNWDFLVILEGDFSLNKANGDRGGDPFLNFREDEIGMSGNSFGIEKLDFGYDFGPARLSTGWNTKFLDINTGGILYGDDHPYIGLNGKCASTSWELLYLIIQDDIDDAGGVFDGDNIDWRVYTLRAGINTGTGLTVAPMYAFSDNPDHEAQTHYLGVEAYGKMGIITPRFEVVYATGEMDKDSDATGPAATQDHDIDAFGAYGSVELDLGPVFNPYVGGYYLSGDDNPTDDELEAFNGIGNISRYTPTFGMENALIYRFVPALGTHLYSNNFNTLGSTQGYGGISNSSRGNAPGMIMYGGGSKGQINENLSYKVQVMYFTLAEEDALGIQNDDMGLEFDLNLTYTFSNHFSIGNTLSIFEPGDAVEDLNGPDFDQTAYLDTIEMKWSF